MIEQSKSKTPISIIIPVYNSGAAIAGLVERLDKALRSVGYRYELILVNDGSRDQSWQVINEISLRYPQVHGINLMRNYGQHNALLCGLRAASYPISVTMDDDLQHLPEHIPDLLAELHKGFDVVYGTPTRQQHGLWRNLASTITRLALQSTMGVENARKVSAFRALRTELRQAFSSYRSPFVTLDVLLAWGTNQFSSIPIEHAPRQAGTSNYTFRKLLQHAMNMMTGFTTLPLQLASMLGFTFALFGLLVLVYVVGRFISHGGSVPGFPFLASIIAIFSGVQLFSLGIIGEYLARMHFRLMEKPAYVIRNQTATSPTHPQESQ